MVAGQEKWQELVNGAGCKKWEELVMTAGAGCGGRQKLVWIQFVGYLFNPL